MLHFSLQALDKEERARRRQSLRDQGFTTVTRRSSQASREQREDRPKRGKEGGMDLLNHVYGRVREEFKYY